MAKILKIPIDTLDQLTALLPDDCSQFTAVKVKNKWVISLPRHK